VEKNKNIDPLKNKLNFKQDVWLSGSVKNKATYLIKGVKWLEILQYCS